MHGWMKAEEITRERIIEAAEMAYSLFGAKTTVFWTAPFTNNVKTNEIMEQVRQVNLMIYDVARTWHETHPGSTMLVMDYAMYIINSRAKGMKSLHIWFCALLERWVVAGSGLLIPIWKSVRLTVRGVRMNMATGNNFPRGRGWQEVFCEKGKRYLFHSHG